jgi:transcriptional regulator with XRE-family HTH domain
MVGQEQHGQPSKEYSPMIIRKLRLDKGLSQEQLADMAGISTRTLQRIERGAKASPETLKCLAAVLEVGFKDLHEEQTMTDNTSSLDPIAQQAIPVPVSASTAFSGPAASQAPTHSADPVLPELSEEERNAMEYVRDIKSFYSHAMTYGCVMVLLLVINLVTNPGYLWVIWPALGWGVGLAIQGFNTFEVINLFGDNWERRQIEKRLRRKHR